MRKLDVRAFVSEAGGKLRLELLGRDFLREEEFREPAQLAQPP